MRSSRPLMPRTPAPPKETNFHQRHTKGLGPRWCSTPAIARSRDAPALLARRLVRVPACAIEVLGSSTQFAASSQRYHVASCGVQRRADGGQRTHPVDFAECPNGVPEFLLVFDQ